MEKIVEESNTEIQALKTRIEQLMQALKIKESMIEVFQKINKINKRDCKEN